MHCVDLGESFQTHIFLQNLVSIQPRTSPLKSDEMRVGEPARRRDGVRPPRGGLDRCGHEEAAEPPRDRRRRAEADLRECGCEDRGPREEVGVPIFVMSHTLFKISNNEREENVFEQHPLNKIVGKTE